MHSQFSHSLQILISSATSVDFALIIPLSITHLLFEPNFFRLKSSFSFKQQSPLVVIQYIQRLTKWSTKQKIIAIIKWYSIGTIFPLFRRKKFPFIRIECMSANGSCIRKYGFLRSFVRSYRSI